MVFRLPSHHLDSFVPAPAQQPQSSGQNEFWRGSLVVVGMRDSNPGGAETIRVVAVETDGEKMQQWPTLLHCHVIRERPVLAQFRAWLAAQQTPIPTCAFMADKLQDSALDPAINLGHFRSLSSFLFDRNMIAIARWGTGSFPGGGIILHPIQNGTTMLIGSVFLYTPLPDINSFPAMSPTSPPRQQIDYAQERLFPIQHTHYGSSPPHHRHDPSLSPHGSNPNSPIEQPISTQGRVSYNRFVMNRPGPSNVYNPHMTPPDHSSWVKAEEENGYAVPPNHDHTHSYP